MGIVENQYYEYLICASHQLVLQYAKNYTYLTSCFIINNNESCGKLDFFTEADKCDRLIGTLSAPLFSQILDKAHSYYDDFTVFPPIKAALLVEAAPNM